MEKEQIQSEALARGIAAVAEAIDINFWDVLDDLIQIGTLNEGHRTWIEFYMETL